MSDTRDTADAQTSFLGRGWSIPPEFRRAPAQAAGVVMTADQQDIEGSLRVLFGTQLGERFLVPGYGLDVHELQFEPVSTTMRTYVKDRVRTAILVYEPRITLLSLDVDTPDPNDGTLLISIEYEVRATNSRFNLVYPFYRTDSNELRASVHAGNATGRV